MNKYLRAFFTLIVFSTLTATFPLQQLLNFLNCYKHFTLTCLQWPPFWKRNKKYTTLKCAHASVVQTKSPSTVVVADVAAVCRELCVSIKRKAKLAQKWCSAGRPAEPPTTQNKNIRLFCTGLIEVAAPLAKPLSQFIFKRIHWICLTKKKKLIIGHTHRLDSKKDLKNFYSSLILELLPTRNDSTMK